MERASRFFVDKKPRKGKKKEDDKNDFAQEELPPSDENSRTATETETEGATESKNPGRTFKFLLMI